jgi:hypothetical protein
MTSQAGRTMKQFSIHSAEFAIWAAALLLVLPGALRAQQQDPTTSSSSSSQESSSAQRPDDQAPALSAPSTPSLDTGQSLQNTNRISPLRFGHLSLLSFDALYDYDSNFTFSPSNPQPADALALRGLVFYTVGGGRTRLDVQWRPFLLVSQTNTKADFAGQTVDIHTYRYLSARWLLNVDDRFQYAPDNGLLANPSFNPDFTTGLFNRQPFLANGESTLTNGFTASLSYQMNQKNTLTFHGQYQYVNQWNNGTNPNPPPAIFDNTHTFGGGIAWTHRLTEGREIGVDYNYDRQYLADFSSRSQYHSAFLTYSDRIRPTLLLRVAFGPSLQIRSGSQGISSGNTETFEGSVEVLKSFRRSNLAFSYGRGHDFQGIITEAYHDRYDLTYSWNMGRNWEFSTGAGYIEQGSSNVPLLRGRTLWFNSSYFVSRQWSVFATYMNSAASGGPQPYGTRNLIMAGIRWSWQGERETN